MATEQRREHVEDPEPSAQVIRFPSNTRPDTPQHAEPGLRTVIGEVLRDERHRQDRTLADVADAAAVSLPYLSEIERGRKEISSDLLGSVCDALDLRLVDVFELGVRRLRAGSQSSPGGGIQLRAA